MKEPALLTRRKLLQTGLAAGAGLALASGDSGHAAEGANRAPAPALRFRAEPIELVRIGLVGVGNMGMNHVRSLIEIEGCRIQAVCDIVPEEVLEVQALVRKAGFPTPRGYSRGERDFERLCSEEDCDLVLTATPWRWHVPVCVAAMENGKHAATEVPAAYTVEDCWKLVETSEKHARHCVMMENCCYGRNELEVFMMARAGLLGELLHGEGGYLHDLRDVQFAEGGEGLWRRAHSSVRDGNLYPTHGLGPIAQCMNINRGDRFDYLVSMSSPARGLANFAQGHFEPEDPRRNETFVNGDVNTVLIKTHRGRSIIVQHCVDSPRPYSRIGVLQGTRGIVRIYPDPRVHVEGRSAAHAWERLDAYRPEFEHPLWKTLGKVAHNKSHGGMDFIEDYRLVQCLREGIATDMDVYDAAAWSVIGPLSEQSVAHRARSVDIPDFTRGRWQEWPPLDIVQA